jgi:hypothetical protein
MSRAVDRKIGRRALLRGGALLLLAPHRSLPAALAGQEDHATVAPVLRAGLVTDVHYADKPTAGSRHYRQSLGKLEEAVERLNGLHPHFVIELGDLVDAASEVEDELRYLKRVNQTFAAAASPRHYVLGNHCVDTLTKPEFLETVERDASFYRFSQNGWHFLVLDSCFRSDMAPYGRRNATWDDPNIPPEQVEWLIEELERAEGPVVVFAHQRLDVGSPYGVKNAEVIRDHLEASGKVRAVFQGHSHKNDYREIAGIHYCTLVAMVEGDGAEQSGYSLLDLYADGSLRLEGFRRQSDYRWSPPPG